MDLQEESSKLGSLRNTSLRNLSSSSSAFFSANQSPFFSPKSPTYELSTNSSTKDIQKLDSISSSCDNNNDTSRHQKVRKKKKKMERKYETSVSSITPISTSFSSNRLRSYDVYIGFNGCNKPLLTRFTNWLQSELEAQGISCFVTDQSQSRNSRKNRINERAMDDSSFGVLILTKKSLKNPYTIEELRFFTSKKNLVPIYYDVGPDDCMVRDIIEKRGEIWEKHGGELWLSYGGTEKEWKEAVNALSRVDELKLEAFNGNWRNCILTAVTLLAMRLGRRSVVDKLNKWRDKVEKEEFPYPRHQNFIGRKKELSELEYILFGDLSSDKRDFLELKLRKKRKNISINWSSRSNSIDEKRKGKELMIEMNRSELRSPENNRRKKRSMIKPLYGKGIACVTGESGIGKTELLLEFAHKFHQKYKMVLWIGGESRYIRQNFLNLWSFLEIEVGVDNYLEKTRIKSFDEQESLAIARVKKELMRNIPFLVIIDNLESEKDWWDHKLIMDLLPRFGCETHIIISTRLSRVMNLTPLKLSYLSSSEAMLLMQGNNKDYSINEIESLKVIEENLGRLTLGLAIIGAILNQIPINPSKLLDTINRVQSRENNFLAQVFEVCFSIFDHAEGIRRTSVATRMVLASGWFGPSPIPVSLLYQVAHKVPKRVKIWRKILRYVFKSGYGKKSVNEASSMLLRFNLARVCIKDGYIQFNRIIKVYARKRGSLALAYAMAKTVITKDSITQNPEHIWAACFLIFKLGNDPIIIELKVKELLFVIKEVILPLAIKSFLTFSRCNAALTLLRLCTDALESADQVLVSKVEKWLDKSVICWGPVQTNAQLNPVLWQELALTRAIVLETRAKLMIRGGEFDIGDDLIRKAIFIRTSINGEDHVDTVSAKEILGKITRLQANVQHYGES